MRTFTIIVRTPSGYQIDTDRVKAKSEGEAIAKLMKRYKALALSGHDNFEYLVKLKGKKK